MTAPRAEKAARSGAAPRSDNAPRSPGRTRAIHKVLVANRGEIAIRVCRTLREMGIASVAVFSEADREAAHVYAADEALLLGPAAASQSYLNVEAVLGAAKRAGADAIHPGYGFLSESAAFAEAVEQAGLVWIGPSPEAVRAMGDKVRARALAIRAGVPVLPGTDGPVADPAELRRAAEQIGYPVVLKAAAGGGGKGMRRVNRPDEFEHAVKLTQGEAKNAFGDDRLYLERWLEKPRHIEVQVFGDAHGSVIALGERDCSIQRRHQKVVEESPSPALSPEKRQELWDLGVRAARAGGYTNAGTAEFLMDARGNFYFLEMNARLQVEHPVTEMVLGMDLVREQVRIARGERLTLTQEEVKPRGAAIEFRIYAEDPSAGFLPQAGTVRRLELPSGPGVRVDFGVREGGLVPFHYDPLVGKIIVGGATREEAVARARRVLGDCRIEGIPTTLPFHLWLLEQAAFVDGSYDTAYLAHHFHGLEPPPAGPEEDDAMVLAALFAHIEAVTPRVPYYTPVESRWRSGAALRAEPRDGGRR
ncbi:MAG TPA: acetyl-CoA carboxylase biotin carboxylase subunit [Candidatus Eisenbacteria bacterium]|nr:acetyl-CoA carboxylase biotin carboxylase subunit [Candidatus Eisenbacteria bacterium]